MATDPISPKPADCRGVPDPCALMKDALTAYNVLITGRKPVELTIDGETTKFNMTKVSALKDHIRMLHLVCPNELSAAITGLPLNGRRSARTMVFADAHIGVRKCC